MFRCPPEHGAGTKPKNKERGKLYLPLSSLVTDCSTGGFSVLLPSYKGEEDRYATSYNTVVAILAHPVAAQAP